MRGLVDYKREKNVSYSARVIATALLFIGSPFIIASLILNIKNKNSLDENIIADSLNCIGEFLNVIGGNTVLIGGIAFGIVRHLSKNGVVSNLTDSQIALRTFLPAFCGFLALFVIFVGLRCYEEKQCKAGSNINKAEGLSKEDIIYITEKSILDMSWVSLPPIGFVINSVVYLVDVYKERKASNAVSESNIEGLSANGQVKN